jgi:hypothetical protein
MYPSLLKAPAIHTARVVWSSVVVSFISPNVPYFHLQGDSAVARTTVKKLPASYRTVFFIQSLVHPQMSFTSEYLGRYTALDDVQLQRIEGRYVIPLGGVTSLLDVLLMVYILPLENTIFGSVSLPSSRFMTDASPFNQEQSRFE